MLLLLFFFDGLGLVFFLVFVFSLSRALSRSLSLCLIVAHSPGPLIEEESVRRCAAAARGHQWREGRCAYAAHHTRPRLPATTHPAGDGQVGRETGGNRAFNPL